MSQESYLKIEEHFHLPQVTLHALSNESGIFHRYMEYDESEPGKLRRIGIYFFSLKRAYRTDSGCLPGVVVKVPQKFQIGNYGLSLSHDFTTGFSTGVLHGTGVMRDGADFPMWPKRPSEEIFDMAKAVPHLWTQPMLLPAILLQHYVFRAEFFCSNCLGSRFVDMQRQLGASRAGRLHQAGPYEDPVGRKTIKETRVNLRNLTGEMSTCLTDITWYCHVSDWQCECLDFLGRTLDEVAGRMDTGDGGSRLRETRELKECIEYLASDARGLRGHNYRWKEVIQADFNVVGIVLERFPRS